MPPKQKLNLQKALKQHAQGMSYREIATAQGVGKSSVFQMLSPILKNLADPDTLSLYREKQADIIDGLTVRTLAAITDEKLANASAKDLWIGAAVGIDKSRLIQGQSTSNSSIMLRAVMDTWQPSDEAAEKVVEE